MRAELTSSPSLSSRPAQWGVGSWRAILDDPTLTFQDRSAVDLKDRSVACLLGLLPSHQAGG